MTAGMKMGWMVVLTVSARPEPSIKAFPHRVSITGVMDS